MTKQSGFTLIELIVVIVILGILAATAAPKFIDLKKDAEIAAAQGAAGAIASATAMNYGKYAVGTGTEGSDYWGVTSCTDTNIKKLLQDDGILNATNGYTLDSGSCPTDTGGSIKEGATVKCKLRKANATAVGNADVYAVVTCTPGTAGTN